MPTGEHFRRLTEDQVEAIIRDKRPTREVAAAFGIGRRYVRRLRQGLAWKRVWRRIHGQ